MFQTRLGNRRKKMEEADAKAERGPRLLPITSIDALLSWGPGSRPDDLFCRASVPLRIEDGEKDVRHSFSFFWILRSTAMLLDPDLKKTSEEQKKKNSPPRPPSASSPATTSRGDTATTPWRAGCFIRLHREERATRSLPPPRSIPPPLAPPLRLRSASPTGAPSTPSSTSPTSS